VREYTEQHYLPAAKAYLERAANNGLRGKQIEDQLSILKSKWNSIQFGEVKVTTIENWHTFDVHVYLIFLDSNTLQVELFANGLNGQNPVIIKMERVEKKEYLTIGHHYRAVVNSARPASDFTPRITPNLPGVSVPLETDLILWLH
jgi:starch phosphorylase